MPNLQVSIPPPVSKEGTYSSEVGFLWLFIMVQFDKIVLYNIDFS